MSEPLPPYVFVKCTLCRTPSSTVPAAEPPSRTADFDALDTLVTQNGWLVMPSTERDHTVHVCPTCVTVVASALADHQLANHPLSWKLRA